MFLRTKTRIHLYSAVVVTIFVALSVSSYAEIYQRSNQPMIQLSPPSVSTPNTLAEQAK